MTISQRLSIQPLATPMTATMSPNSLKLVRFSVASSAVRARSLNAVKSPKNNADFRNTSGVMAAADEHRIQRQRTREPDGQKEGDQEQVLEPEHGLCHFVGFCVVGDQRAQGECAQVALQSDQLEKLSAAQGEEQSAEHQELAMADFLQNK